MNELKLSVVHFTHQNPMQICACSWIYRWTKNYGKSALGRRAAGRWAVVACGRGPVGLRAAGPLGRSGPWAAGLFLAKPQLRTLCRNAF